MSERIEVTKPEPGVIRIRFGDVSTNINSRFGQSIAVSVTEGEADELCRQIRAIRSARDE